MSASDASRGGALRGPACACGGHECRCKKPVETKGNDFFSTCDRDEGGHCKPGTGAGGGTEKPQAPAPSVAPPIKSPDALAGARLAGLGNPTGNQDMILAEKGGQKYVLKQCQRADGPKVEETVSFLAGWCGLPAAKVRPADKPDLDAARAGGWKGHDFGGPWAAAPYAGRPLSDEEEEAHAPAAAADLLFAYAVGNVDRSPANLLLGPDGVVRSIDWEPSFGPETALRGGEGAPGYLDGTSEAVLSAALDRRTVREILKKEPYVLELAKHHPRDGDADEAVRAARERFAVLRRLAGMKAPTLAALERVPAEGKAAACLFAAAARRLSRDRGDALARAVAALPPPEAPPEMALAATGWAGKALVTREARRAAPAFWGELLDAWDDWRASDAAEGKALDGTYPAYDGLDLGLDARAEWLAELLWSIYGDDALAFLADEAEGKAWDESQHPRGEDGRFVAVGSSAAGRAAKDAVSKALAGKKDKASLKETLGALSRLTVAQLKELHREHGEAKMPSGLRRDQLIAAVRSRLEADAEAERQADLAAKKPAEKPASTIRAAAEGQPEMRGRITKEEAAAEPWKFSADQYQSAHGVHRPWIAEISPFQYGAMSRRQREQYDEKRRREWGASIAIKEKWHSEVVAAYEAGRITRDTPGLSDEARSAISRHQAAKDKAAAETQARAEQAGRRISDPRTAKVGERVRSPIYGSGTVQKINRQSIIMAMDRPAGSLVKIPIYAHGPMQLEREEVS